MVFELKMYLFRKEWYCGGTRKGDWLLATTGLAPEPWRSFPCLFFGGRGEEQEKNTKYAIFAEPWKSLEVGNYASKGACLYRSAKKRKHTLKLFAPDIFGWGGGLPRDEVGAKKLRMPLETQGNETLGWISRDFCRVVPEAPEKFVRCGKRGLLERGLCRKVYFLEILVENLEILENLTILEILENLENLEILEIPPVKRPLS